MCLPDTDFENESAAMANQPMGPRTRPARTPPTACTVPDFTSPSISRLAPGNTPNSPSTFAPLINALPAGMDLSVIVVLLRSNLSSLWKDSAPERIGREAGHLL